MTGTGNCIGRVGALAVALGIGRFRPIATRMTVSIGVAAVVVTATVVPARVSEVSPAVKLSADSNALLLCGGACPTFRDADLQVIMNQFITPTHPSQSITPVAVTTPNEDWPITGILRLIGSAVGDPRLFGPGGGGWPDEPWWKLLGLFDLTRDQSNLVGVANLEQAMAAHGNDHLVIYGYSQGAMTANLEKRKLAEQYPAGTAAPDIDFVLGGDANLPNGGLHARFPGLYIPVLDWAFNGPAPTDTQFDTVEINQQYDGAADFPLYPLNIVADLNAVMGFLYLHTYPFDVSLPEDPTTSPAYQGTHGDTSYYFFETQDLPLFAPLRMLGVPESLIDVVEPFFRVLVELGYDRSIPPWEPTPARLIPTLDPVTVTTDLVNAIGEGINNAAAFIGSPPLSVPAPVTLEAPATETARADISYQMVSNDPPPQTGQPITKETVKADNSLQGAATEPVAESDPPTSVQNATDTEQPTSSKSDRAVTFQPAKPRPLVRDSLGAPDQQPGDRSERGEDSRSTDQTAAGAATGEPSSAASSSAGETSSGGASDGDSDGS